MIMRLRRDIQIAAINHWQENVNGHKLTCGNDRGHRPLVPLSQGDAVVLACPDCEYRQTAIPDIVLKTSLMTA